MTLFLYFSATIYCILEKVCYNITEYNKYMSKQQGEDFLKIANCKWQLANFGTKPIIILNDKFKIKNYGTALIVNAKCKMQSAK